MEYLILWFEIDGQWVGTNCRYKDIRKGTVKINIYSNGEEYTIEKCPIQNCKYISKFRYLNSNKKFVKWEDKDKLFKKYPELQKLAA